MTIYWQAHGVPQYRWRDTMLPSRVDYAVIGAGFAGLATAIALREAQPHATVTVLEAEHVGFGASGRNAGLLSPLAAPGWVLAASRSEDAAFGAQYLTQLMHTRAAELKEFAGCELAPVPLILAAHGRHL